MTKILKSSAGFTLIAAMVMVVVIGIMLGAASQSWQTLMKREREAELLFRGSQYRDALARWYKPRPGQGGQPSTQQARSPNELKDLLQDPLSQDKVRYLRRLYPDPITGKDFEPIRDANQRIIGVKSTSTDPPLKKGNFPEDLKELADKNSYSDWQFVYRQQAAPAPAGAAPRPPGG
ncbi:MAG: type II secretion system GspH family protein [Geobacteraceae bacterium]|nr:type II secretion system GspH family protein [Geobacteraceae bacterium]